MTQPTKSSLPTSSLSVPRSLRNSPSIRPQRIRERDFYRRDWGVVLLEGETLEDALHPAFFGLMAHVILPGNHIEVVSSDYRQWAELFVVASDDILRTVATVILHGPLDFSDQAKRAIKFDFAKVLIEEVGGTWRARHGHTILRSEFPNRAAAQKWLADKAAGTLDE